MGIIIAALLSQNFILVKFYGICPFMGVSKKIDTALGMGMAVTFVMALASAACWLVNEFMLIPLSLSYMQTVAFILVIASIVQVVEMFLKKAVPALYKALGVFLPLITTPRTAQLVVIRGRYTPRALYSAGTAFFRNISTTWTMEAMTRMKATVCI